MTNLIRDIIGICCTSGIVMYGFVFILRLPTSLSTRKRRQYIGVVLALSFLPLVGAVSRFTDDAGTVAIHGPMNPWLVAGWALLYALSSIVYCRGLAALIRRDWTSNPTKS